MNKYYFKTTGTIRTICIEPCKIKDNGIMIGSVKCQECKNCLEHESPNPFTGDVDWIKCKNLKEATG